MFVEEMQRAIMGTPRERLADIQAALWKSHAAGAIGDDDAQGLAEMIQAKKAFAAPARPMRRHVGSRPRSDASMARRRSWVSSGWLPPPIAAGFTMGELAALSVVAAEVALHGRGELPVGAIAGRAGVCASTVRNALRQARALGLISVEERRLTYARSLPNVVRITSAEWSSWIALRGRGLVERGRMQIAAAHEYSYSSKRETHLHEDRTARREVERGGRRRR